MADPRARLGQRMDAHFTQSGANFRQARYLGTVGALLPTPLPLSPNPFIWHDNLVRHDETTGPNQNEEWLNQYRISIPRDTHDATFGVHAATAIRHNSLWEISEDEGSTWIPLRCMGRAKMKIARINLVTVEVGI